MRTYRQILEGKQVGIVYHLVGVPQLVTILDKKAITSNNFNNISTTRSKMTNWYLGGPPVIIGKFELDGDKISDRFKVVPFQDVSLTGVKFSGERESTIQSRKLPIKYATKFILIKSNIDKDLQYIDIPWLKDTLARVKIPIYIQVGTRIKKDDKQLQVWGLK
jgi:hypothetical protein